MLAPPPAAARLWVRLAAPGRWEVIDASQLKANAKALTDAASVKETILINRITWNITYLDPSGSGFNDAVFGGERKDAVHSALDTISHVLTYTTGTLDIVFQPSIFDSASYLSLTGTNFPADGVGFFNGMAFDHMKTGRDPDPALEDIDCTVNFGFNLYAGSGTPAGDQYDLQSLLLHELTHGLGLISLADYNGTSSINHKNPGIYSVWDSRLISGSGWDLWNLAGKFIGRRLQPGRQQSRYCFRRDSRL